MTIKIEKIKAHNIDSESGIAKNNLVLVEPIFVTKVDGIIDKSTSSTEITWVSITNGVFASDNETKDKKTVNFYPKHLDITYELSIKGGNIKKTSEGKKFNLKNEKEVDGTTSWSGSQLILVEFISAKKWVFRII